MLFLFRKRRFDPFIAVLIAYFSIFFFLNLYYVDIKELLTKKGYYFTYTLLEYWAFAYILYHTIDNVRFGKLILSLSGVFSVFAVFYFYNASIGRVDSIPIGIETILIFIYIFFYFYQYFKKTDSNHIYNDPGFWFITGILVYLGSTFFFNILGSSISKDYIDNYWYFTYLGDIMKNILAAVAVILYAKIPDDKLKQKKITLPYLDMV